jgi:hypothetical protein
MLAPVAATIIAATLIQAVVRGHDRDAPLVVTRLVLVGTRDVNRFVVEETYRAELTHTGRPGSGDFAAITARLVGAGGFPFPGRSLHVVDGDLEFGGVRAGATVESVDTFAIQRRERGPLTPAQLRWEISARPDLLLPDAWAGQWQMTVTRSDATTSAVSSIDRVTDAIGGDEPVGFSLLPPAVRCGWQGGDRFLQAECRAVFRQGTCLANAQAQVALQLHGSGLDGTGRWDTTVSGDCGIGSGSGGELLQISGVRVGAAGEAEPLSPGVLAKFLIEPGLVDSTAGGDVGRGQPGSERDCRHGRWRRIFALDFHSLNECVAFVTRHHDRDGSPGREEALTR